MLKHLGTQPECSTIQRSLHKTSQNLMSSLAAFVLLLTHAGGTCREHRHLHFGLWCPHVVMMFHDNFLIPSGCVIPPSIAHLIWVTADLLVFITYCSLLEGSMDPSSLHTIGQEILHQCQATSLLFISQLSVEIFEIFSTWFSCVWKIDSLSTS